MPDDTAIIMVLSALAVVLGIQPSPSPIVLTIVGIDRDCQNRHHRGEPYHLHDDEDVMHKPDFLDRFDRLVAFDAETTGKRTPDADFIRRQRSRGSRRGSSSRSVLLRCCATA